MPYFSRKSKKLLSTCHKDLQRLFNEVVKTFDCSILVGYRNEEAQNKAYNSGNSKKKYPESKHNAHPSLAVDVAPYPINFDDIKRFYFFGGYVTGVAEGMDLKIRWGGNWDKDYDVSDQIFNDLLHFELCNDWSSK